MAVPIEFFHGSVSETFELRRTVLGWNTDTIQLDQARGTTHVLAKTPSGAVVGCASLGISDFPDDSSRFDDFKTMRFWGVAVLAPFRGQGIGNLLINRVTELALTTNTNLIWANARESAVSFYTERGFIIVGEGFTDSLSGLKDYRVALELDLRRANGTWNIAE